MNKSMNRFLGEVQDKYNLKEKEENDKNKILAECVFEMYSDDKLKKYVPVLNKVHNKSMIKISANMSGNKKEKISANNVSFIKLRDDVSMISGYQSLELLLKNAISYYSGNCIENTNKLTLEKIKDLKMCEKTLTEEINTIEKKSESIDVINEKKKCLESIISARTKMENSSKTITKNYKQHATNILKILSEIDVVETNEFVHKDNSKCYNYMTHNGCTGSVEKHVKTYPSENAQKLFKEIKDRLFSSVDESVAKNREILNIEKKNIEKKNNFIIKKLDIQLDIECINKNSENGKEYKSLIIRQPTVNIVYDDNDNEDYVLPHLRLNSSLSEFPEFGQQSQKNKYTGIWNKIPENIKLNK